MKHCPKCGDHVVSDYPEYTQCACGSQTFGLHFEQSVKCRLKVLECKIAELTGLKNEKNDMEEEIKRLQEENDKLRYFAGQVKSTYELLQNIESPDFVSWIEDIGERAIEVLKC